MALPFTLSLDLFDSPTLTWKGERRASPSCKSLWIIDPVELENRLAQTLTLCFSVRTRKGANPFQDTV